MAYLHCHSCDWSQDDFWSWSYNPLTKIWSDVKWLARPRVMSLDDRIVNDITEYTGVRVRRSCGKHPGQIKVFSWQWLIVEAVKDWKIFRAQSWWTWESWKSAWEKRTADKPLCPSCGEQNFDID